VSIRRFLVLWSVAFGFFAAWALLSGKGTPWLQWFALGVHVGVLMGFLAFHRPSRGTP